MLYQNDNLFIYQGNKLLVEFIPIDKLLSHFEDEIACEWSTENSNKIRKCRFRQNLIREEIKRRIDK